MPDRSITRILRSPGLATGLVLAGWLLVVLGYWGPWAPAAAAGLRVLGVDLAEYVKFIAEVRSGQIVLTREVFYLPLVALSLSLSLLAHRPELRLAGLARWALNLLAVPAALAMLPPAWTPALLTTPEFVKQTAAIGMCVLAAALAYPVLRRLPARLAAMLIVVLALLAVAPPALAFARLSPALDAIFGHEAPAGRGPWQMALGFALLATGSLLAVQPARRKRVVTPRDDAGVA